MVRLLRSLLEWFRGLSARLKLVSGAVVLVLTILTVLIAWNELRLSREAEEREETEFEQSQSDRDSDEARESGPPVILTRGNWYFGPTGFARNDVIS